MDVPHHEIQALLLQEAQQEIGSLRNELYSTRRIAEERRQAVDQATHAKDQLAQQLADWQHRAQQQQAELATLAASHEELSSVRAAYDQLLREHENTVQARKILEGELHDERTARQGAEEAKARLELERSRLQKARDDLSTQLRVAQQRARDAEEEQCRAEEAMVAMERELQAANAAPGAGGGADTPTGPNQADSNTLRLLVEQIEAERRQSAAQEQRVRHLQAELDTAKAQLRHTEAQLADATRARTDPAPDQGPAPAVHSAAAAVALEEACAQSEKRLVTAQQELAVLREELDRTLAKCAGLEAQLHESREREQERERDRGHLVNGAPATPTGPPSGPPSVGAADAVSLASSSAADVPSAALRAQVESLRRARARLILEFERQGEELERTSAETAALAAEVDAAQTLAAHWQAQAQAALAHISRLKDLMEESASWPVHVASAALGDGGGALLLGEMQNQLLREQARAADLDMQVRALCAEVLKAHSMRDSLGRSVMPVLSNIESRLVQLQSSADL